MTQALTLKNAEISARILAKIFEGATLPQAYDAVLGEGSYLKTAGDLYEALKVAP